MNDNKRLITTALHFSGSLKEFFENYFTTNTGPEEQWELDTEAFIYSYSEYLIFNGKNPFILSIPRPPKMMIYLKQ